MSTVENLMLKQSINKKGVTNLVTEESINVEINSVRLLENYLLISFLWLELGMVTSLTCSKILYDIIHHFNLKFRILCILRKM